MVRNGINESGAFDNKQKGDASLSPIYKCIEMPRNDKTETKDKAFVSRLIGPPLSRPWDPQPQ